jgi:hypothetical protein
MQPARVEIVTGRRRAGGWEPYSVTERRLVVMVRPDYGRRLRRLSSALVALSILALICSACAAFSDPWHFSRGGPYIRVLASGPCPTSLGSARDVRNFGAWRFRELVPASPTGGLICRYAASAAGPPSAAGRPTLYRQVRVLAVEAAELAGVIDKVSTKAPKGFFGCPAGWDTATLIAFSYRAQSDADLWYYDSGCQTLDNGKIGAFQGGNPSFYLHFVPLVDRLAPQTELPPS